MREDLDIDELAKKIEDRLAKLMEDDTKDKKQELDQTIFDFNDLLKQIDEKIKELEEEEKKDIQKLNTEANNKLTELQDIGEKDLEQTFYNLEELSHIINETIDKLEKNRIKKAKKAYYCDLARKKKQQELKKKKCKANKKNNKN